MKKHRPFFSVERMSNVLGVSRAGFYRYLKHTPSKRQQEDSRLSCKLRQFHIISRASYGCRRLKDDFKEHGIKIGKGRVRRLMKENGIAVKYKPPFRVTTYSGHKHPVAPNLLKRHFHADQPNEKWVSDISYIPTKNGFLYLAVILDLYSRMVVGTHMSCSLERGLVLDAFKQACSRRGNQRACSFIRTVEFNMLALILESF